MAGLGRSKNGVAEPVIGTRDFARSRWLAYVPAIHAFEPRKKDVDARHKTGHDEQ
jgi:hypothetical protein